jgi:hypothetical protein
MAVEFRDNQKNTPSGRQETIGHPNKKLAID